MKNLFYRLELNHIWDAMRKRLCEKKKKSKKNHHTELVGK